MSLTADRECETVSRMKSCLLVACVLVLSACGGKDKPKGDCGKAIDNAMALSKEDYKKSNVSDETMPKLRAAMVARCAEDKWTNDAVVCLEKAKSTDDVIKCQNQTTKDQQDNLAKAIAAITAAPPPDPGPGTGAGTGAGTAATNLPAGLPAECTEYAAVVEKLAACDKLPPATRDMLKTGFDTTAKAWADFDKQPEPARKAMADGCKQGTETVKKAVGTTCPL